MARAKWQFGIETRRSSAIDLAARLAKSCDQRRPNQRVSGLSEQVSEQLSTSAEQLSTPNQQTSALDDRVSSLGERVSALVEQITAAQHDLSSGRETKGLLLDRKRTDRKPRPVYDDNSQSGRVHPPLPHPVPKGLPASATTASLSASLAPRASRGLASCCPLPCPPPSRMILPKSIMQLQPHHVHNDSSRQSPVRIIQLVGCRLHRASHPQRRNRHSARGTLAAHLARALSPEAFGYRPQCVRRPSRRAGIRNPSHLRPQCWRLQNPIRHQIPCGELNHLRRKTSQSRCDLTPDRISDVVSLTLCTVADCHSAP